MQCLVRLSRPGDVQDTDCSASSLDTNAVITAFEQTVKLEARVQGPGLIMNLPYHLGFEPALRLLRSTPLPSQVYP